MIAVDIADLLDSPTFVSPLATVPLPRLVARINATLIVTRHPLPLHLVPHGQGLSVSELCVHARLIKHLFYIIITIRLIALRYLSLSSSLSLTLPVVIELQLNAR